MPSAKRCCVCACRSLLTGWSAPSNETGKAEWMVEALTQLWGQDPNVAAVLPFLLAGPFWDADGWPWTRWSNTTVRPLAQQRAQDP